MWAKVDENGAVTVIRNPLNFPVADKTVVTDIRGLSAAKRKTYGVYEYIPYIKRPYDEIVSMDLKISKTYMTITETPLLAPVDLDALKVAKIKHMKDHANNILSKTDWYVIRKMENGTEIPTDIATTRNDVKAAVAAQEAYLSDAARTADELTVPETGLEAFE